MLGTDRSTEIGAIEKKYPDSVVLASANPVAFTLTCKYWSIRAHIRLREKYHRTIHRPLRSFRFLFLVPINLDVKMKALILGALFLIVSSPIKVVRNWFICLLSIYRISRIIEWFVYAAKWNFSSIYIFSNISNILLWIQLFYMLILLFYNLLSYSST